MNMDRRSLIIGAGFATAAPALVRAESLLEMPGDPLTARGLLAATKWAAEGFGELPACRLAFSDEKTTNWMAYTCMRRERNGVTSYAVAIEVVTTDAEGRRFITSVPVDGVKLHKDHDTYRRAHQAKVALRAWKAAPSAELPF